MIDLVTLTTAYKKHNQWTFTDELDLILRMFLGFSSGGSRISQRGRQLYSWGFQPFIFGIFSRELHEKYKKLDPTARISDTIPLGAQMVRDSRYSVGFRRDAWDAHSSEPNFANVLCSLGKNYPNIKIGSLLGMQSTVFVKSWIRPMISEPGYKINLSIGGPKVVYSFKTAPWSVQFAWFLYSFPEKFGKMIGCHPTFEFLTLRMENHWSATESFSHLQYQHNGLYFYSGTFPLRPTTI